jgi:RNA polymerase sigma-70 factor (ECF subfamily)
MNSDKKLIVNYLVGDEKSLEILIHRYLKPIYSFVYRYVGNGDEAEDITQEVFVKMWKSLKKFDQKKKFKTWIFTIAKNACLDFLKKKKTIPFSEFENEEGENKLIETLVDPAPLPDELFERASIGEMLSAAINQLAPKYCLVLSLRYNDHFTFREITRVLGEPLNTIKSRYRRALIKLKRLLSDS